MREVPDYIIDRSKLKQQVLNWRMIAVITVFLFLLTMIISDSNKAKSNILLSNYIARIYVNGLVLYDMEVIQSLQKLAEEDNSKAVIVHINSPGGTAVGGESYYNALKKIAEKKPIVVVMGDVAASGGYMAALASDHIIAHQMTITGSIGAFAQSFEVTEMAHKLGIKLENFKSSPLKGSPLPTEQVTPEIRAAVMDMVNDTYNMFFELVASARKIPVENLKKIADGRVYTGRQALQLGLIDEIGDEDAALNWLRKEKGVPPTLQVEDYTLVKEVSNLDKFLESSSEMLSLLKTLTKNNFIPFF